MNFGTLYLVATPIGNYEDITFRALETLKKVDLIVFEERREANRLLNYFKIEKPLESLNEHNELASTEVILSILKSGKSVAIISDSGTPIFSDPGRLLVKRAIKLKIKIVPIPGASSLMPSIIVSGFSIDKFLFYGWLSPKRERRIAELKKIKNEEKTIILMDTPYRLSQVLRDICLVFGEDRNMSISFNLTMKDEEIFYGTTGELNKKFSNEQKKGEFVIVIEGKK